MIRSKCIHHCTCHPPWPLESQDIGVIEDPGNLLSVTAPVPQQPLSRFAWLREAFVIFNENKKILFLIRPLRHRKL